MLTALLHTTFVQVPLLHVRDAFRNRRFVLTILLGTLADVAALLARGLSQWLRLPMEAG